MYPVLILREEFVCLIILSFLRFTAGSYHMGKDSKSFYRLLFFATLHVIFDIITVWTVNHVETVPPTVNYLCHIAFYMAAILYSREISIYVFNMSHPKHIREFSIITLVLAAAYLCCIPFLNIEYQVCNGTNSSAGSAAIVGYSLGFLYFLIALIIIVADYKKLSRSVKNALLPMMFILIIAEIGQMLVRELLFTGGAVTIVTVGFFFSLENPVHVFEQKVNTDALTGLRSRHSYDEEIAVMDKKFREEPSDSYIFAYCDINNLRGVNSSFGHQEGDNYITFIARGLSSCLRHAGSIYRMGGDEFLAVYIGCPEETVSDELKKLQEYCRESERKMDYIPAVAVGYAVSGKDYKSLIDVIRTADYIMYKNKAKMSVYKTYISSSAGTRLNLSGLTDRVFNAMCESNKRSYPFITNLETNVTRVAPGWKEFFDLPDEYMVGFLDIWKEFIHPDDRTGFMDSITVVLNEKEKYYDGEFRACSAGGEFVKCSCYGAIYHGKDGEPDIFAGYMINHGVPEKVDAVTGLPNFLVTDEYVQEAIDNDRQAIIVKLEINQFNRVNMLYGYIGGDRILREMATIIQDNTSQYGKAFCQDGTNFTLFLPDCSRKDANILYDRLSYIFSSGIEIDNIMVPLDISGGAFEIIPGIKMDRPTIRSSLLYALEESVYSEHSKLVFYEAPSADNENPEFKLLAAVHHDAITNMKYFDLWYQTIFDSVTGKVKGAEALLRWIHPEYGEVKPGRFIKFLENDPAYYNLGLRIIREALKGCLEFRKINPDFSVNVNITAEQLQHENFIPSLQSMITELSVPPDHLVLELTERCKELDMEFLYEKITALRKCGVKVAFDDMGTGYSTIALLLNIPVDEIKLDYAFTRELTENKDYQVFVDALVKGRENRGYMICFEGIESEEQQQFVKKYGNTLSQGYFYSKPVPTEKVIEAIKS
ncbi:MAG: EAL domain-containing protein [Eubacteriales bacterium]|nr:EAL domain-containing protein [Eubacteriales bacterium]